MFLQAKLTLMHSGLFEVEGRSRLEPMEGLRGVAVFLVFLQHYCRQSLETSLSYTLPFAEVLRNFGNRGVELFFVLSGFLIYGILLQKRPNFLSFMTRRAQRIYPAFIAVFILAIALDYLRAHHRIPNGVAGLVYLGENFLFLPGLFPIDPLFTVNWSLSYEWWFYACLSFFFAAFKVASLNPPYRVAAIVAAASILIALDIFQGSNVPIRGLCFFAGMLLVEYRLKERANVPWPVAMMAAIVAFITCTFVRPPDWGAAPVLAVAYFLLCCVAFGRSNPLAQMLSFKYLRWFGNISYSFYLIHAIVIIAVLRLLQPLMLRYVSADVVFVMLLAPAFAAALAVSAVLFIGIEKPFSLGHVSRKVSASPKTLITTPQP